MYIQYAVDQPLRRRGILTKVVWPEPPPSRLWPRLSHWVDRRAPRTASAPPS